jgi:hypothetical protein
MSWLAVAVWYGERALRWLAGAVLWAGVIAVATAPVWMAFMVGRCSA